MKIEGQQLDTRVLVQNYGFSRLASDSLDITYVYPDFAADGNDERFRFHDTLRRELAERVYIVRDDLQDKYTIQTNHQGILREVDAISPRLEIAANLDLTINSIYFDPTLVVGVKEDEFSAYIFKTIIVGSIAWFELKDEEKIAVREMLARKSQERPFRQALVTRVQEAQRPSRNFFQRLFGRG